MNFNANNSRQTHRLAAKRLPQEIEISSPNHDILPPTYNPYENQAPPPVYSQYPPDMNVVAPGTYYPPPQGGVAYNPNNPYASAAPYPAESGVGVSIPQFDPLVKDMAMQYGQHLMGTGKQYMDREFEKYVPVTRLKYYFAVDTSYVANKLRLLFFPFTNQDWSLKYAPTEPIQPRFDLHAPDLYIPSMAYLTYVLVAGLALGIQDRFTPEVLGIQASSALVWLILEVLLYTVYLYITNITTTLTTIDIIAFVGYKFTGIIFAVLTSLVFLKTGYYCGLAYSGLTLAYFLMRTLKVRILSINNPTQTGNTRRMYLLMTVACLQPLMMWFLSYHLVPSAAAVTDVPIPPISS